MILSKNRKNCVTKGILLFENSKLIKLMLWSSLLFQKHQHVKKGKKGRMALFHLYTQFDQIVWVHHFYFSTNNSYRYNIFNLILFSFIGLNIMENYETSSKCINLFIFFLFVLLASFSFTNFSNVLNPFSLKFVNPIFKNLNHFTLDKQYFVFYLKHVSSNINMDVVMYV